MVSSILKLGKDQLRDYLHNPFFGEHLLEDAFLYE